MVALGDVPNPITGKLDPQPKQAKHFIDTLAMLEEKTNGNRTPEESALLSSFLHQLRMAFVGARETRATDSKRGLAPSPLVTDALKWRPRGACPLFDAHQWRNIF